MRTASLLKSLLVASVALVLSSSTAFAAGMQGNGSGGSGRPLPTYSPGKYVGSSGMDSNRTQRIPTASARSSSSSPSAPRADRPMPSYTGTPRVGAQPGPRGAGPGAQRGGAPPREVAYKTPGGTDVRVIRSGGITTTTTNRTYQGPNGRPVSAFTSRSVDSNGRTVAASGGRAVRYGNEIHSTATHQQGNQVNVVGARGPAGQTPTAVYNRPLWVGPKT